MARLPKGQKARRERRVEHLLQRSGLGLTEEELAGELGWHRRTVNNYLHELDRQEKAHRHGRKWFPG